MSGDLRTMLLETTPTDVSDLDVDRLVRRGTRRRRVKRAGAAVAVLALVTTGSVAVLGSPPADRIPVISQEDAGEAAGDWHQVPDAPMSERARATVATDGHLVALFGGEVQAMVELGGTTYGDYTANDGAIYDAARDKWSAIPPAPLPPRAGANVALADDRLVVVGGRVLAEVPGGGVWHGDQALTLDTALFDLSTDTWRSLGAPDIAVRTPEIVAWDGTRLVLWGGSGDDHGALMDGATWTEAEGWTTIPPTPLEARSGAAVAVAGDRLVVWGGTRQPDGGDADDLFADGAVFDLADGSWEVLPDGPLSPRWLGHDGWPHQENVRVDGDRILIVGGATTGANHQHDGAWLDLADGSWSPIAPIPTEARYAVAQRGGVIAIGDETDAGQPYVTLWRYDEEGDAWDRSPTRLRSDLAVHHLSPERIVVSSTGDDGRWQDSPRIGIWEAAAAKAVHTRPPLSGRTDAAIAPLPEGVLVWGGLEIEPIGEEASEGRPVSDGARLDR